ncbi:hypothetical protein BJ878DRAFT_497141 [Calycina marina]|uniref:Uncharacterized protein n=1 Tax=Calycina marina TaxID=1763456 RepID=A0A9P7Z6B1_9HELO|nr:hypothetical protein BJ878DRAFT_497141 [Calycina marina]
MWPASSLSKSEGYECAEELKVVSAVIRVSWSAGRRTMCDGCCMRPLPPCAVLLPHMEAEDNLLTSTPSETATSRRIRQPVKQRTASKSELYVVESFPTGPTKRISCREVLAKVQTAIALAIIFSSLCIIIAIHARNDPNFARSGFFENQEGNPPTTAMDLGVSQLISPHVVHVVGFFQNRIWQLKYDGSVACAVFGLPRLE